MEACNRVKAAQEREKTLQEELADARLCTTGVIVKAKHHCLGLIVRDFVKEAKEKEREEVCVAAEKYCAYVIDSQRKLEHVLVKNNPPCNWTISDLTTILRVIKTKEDGPMPKKKPDLWHLYQSLKHRSNDLIIYESMLCGTSTVTNVDSIPDSNSKNQHQTDVLLSSEERDAAFALGNMFESV